MLTKEPTVVARQHEDRIVDLAVLLDRIDQGLDTVVDTQQRPNSEGRPTRVGDCVSSWGGIAALQPRRLVADVGLVEAGSVGVQGTGTDADYAGAGLDPKCGANGQYATKAGLSSSRQLSSCAAARRCCSISDEVTGRDLLSVPVDHRVAILVVEVLDERLPERPSVGTWLVEAIPIEILPLNPVQYPASCSHMGSASFKATNSWLSKTSLL